MIDISISISADIQFILKRIKKRFPLKREKTVDVQISVKHSSFLLVHKLPPLGLQLARN